MAENQALLDATDWAATPLGPQASWPADMRSVVTMAMASGFPVCTAWCDDGIQANNDAHNPTHGENHPDVQRHAVAAGQARAPRGMLVRLLLQRRGR
jgi:hypothetical protein